MPDMVSFAGKQTQEKIQTRTVYSWACKAQVVGELKKSKKNAGLFAGSQIPRPSLFRRISDRAIGRLHRGESAAPAVTKQIQRSD